MKILFLISIILLLLLLKKNIEPVILSCCGGIRLHHDFEETDPDPPKKVRRCMKDWNMPCTGKGSPSCCEGKDYCKSTREGGKCKKKDGSGYYIYKGDTKAKVDYMPEQEREDINERRKNERNNNEGDDGDDDSDGDKDSGGMEIVNYVLIGIILIVILVLVGLFFFSGDEKSATKTALDKYGKYGTGADKYGARYGTANRPGTGANRYGTANRYDANRSGANRYGANRYDKY